MVAHTGAEGPRCAMEGPSGHHSHAEKDGVPSPELSSRCADLWAKAQTWLLGHSRPLRRTLRWRPAGATWYHCASALLHKSGFTNETALVFTRAVLKYKWEVLVYS